MSRQHAAAVQLAPGMHMALAASIVRGAAVHATPAAWHVDGHGPHIEPSQSTPAVGMRRHVWKLKGEGGWGAR
jgi:hypothetical protein